MSKKLTDQTEKNETDLIKEETAAATSPQDKAEPVVDPTDATKSDISAEAVVDEVPPTVDNPNARWYVVHTYSGHENKVATTLRQRVESMGIEDKIFDILVPTQEKIEVREGKKVTVHDKIFPGYILIRMELNDETWAAVRQTQGVTSFVGIGNKPTALPDDEVETILKFTKMEAPMYRASFSIGEAIKIIDGPFADFLGTVDEINEEKGKVKALISIFGRETPVELDFLQVSKI